MSKPIQITVGGAGLYDPAIGATDCPVSTLKGIEMYVEKEGAGTMPYTSYTALSNGGFRLSSGTFQAGEIYFLHPTGLLLQTASANYTNGFNYAQVINALLGRVGWRNSTLSDQPILSTVNLTSRSGRYFNDAHSLVTIPNIKALLDNPAMTDDDLNAELEVLQKSVIMRSLTAVFGAPELLEQVLLFERQGRLNTPMPNQGQFVGYQIEVAEKFNKAVQIDSATMLFDSNVTFPVYLFKDGKKTPVWSQSVTVVANEATVVDFSDLILNYITPTTKGGRFYFGYFQNDLGSAKAIREQIECWNKTLCFSAEPFYSKQTGPADFDRDFYSEPMLPYGMNLQISSFSDWSGMIVKKGNIFDELFMLTMAYVIIEKLVYTTRSNGSERVLKEGLPLAAAIADLTGSAPVSDGPPAIMGLNTRIEREALRVRNNLFPRKKAITVNLATNDE